MEFFDMAQLATVSGAASAVTLVTYLLKKMFKVSGKCVIGIALILSLIIMIAVFPITSMSSALVAFLNAVVVTAVAVGINEGVKK